MIVTAFTCKEKPALATIIILAVFGIFLIGLEIFLPGGILGIIGLICSIAAVVLCFTTEAVAQVGGWFPFALAGILVAVTSVVLIYWLKYFEKTGVGKRFVLDSAIAGKNPDKADLVGKEGEAVSNLDPLGKILIGGKKMEARAETGAVDRGSKVTVVKSSGLELVVREITDNEAESAAETSEAGE